MSQKNVEIVRQIYERWERGDFRAGVELLEGAVIVGEEFLDAGDSVVVRVNQQATGAGSGVPVGMRYYQIWTFRGRSVIRIESIRGREEALEAAGLQEPQASSE